MPKLTIYQKPTCSTCRTVMKRLQEAGVDFDSINYIIDPPSRTTLAELVKKAGVSAREFLRTKEMEYKELGLNSPDVSDADILDAMAAHPILIQRPILEYGNSAALTRPAEKVEEILAAWKLGNT